MTRSDNLPFMTFANAADGLAAEMDMLDQVANGAAPRAFLWQARNPGLVLPDRFARSDLFPAAAAESAKAGWPVAPRKTGGGITPQGPGVLNLALAFVTGPGQSRTIQQSYGVICDPLIAAFGDLGLNAEATPVSGSFCDGDYNLAIDGRKFVGTAQRWRGNACLCHALILTDLDLEPAVDAVARLSQALEHDTRFDTCVHCALAMHLPQIPDITANTAQAIWSRFEAQGFVAN